MKNNIAKISSSFLFLFLVHCLNAQVDPKYLAGAVPEKDGKVIFSDSIIFSGMSKDMVYEKALMWAEANYKTEKSRVVYINKEDGVISCRGESEIVFSAGALSLDRTFMIYQLNIFCYNGSCKAEIKSISYLYNVANKRDPEKYTAEEWITDKEAVNKDKLYRNNGKFRIRTIDLVDDIYNSMATTISTGEIDLYYEKNKTNAYSRQTGNIRQGGKKETTGQQQDAVTTNTVSAPAQAAANPSQPVVTQQIVQATGNAVNNSSGELASFKKLDPQKIPGNIIKMLSEDWMLITAGNDNKYNMMTASWGGLGHFWGKPVAFCFINPARYTYQLMETNETYTLSFYTETYRETLRYCGTTSGKDTDKIKGSELTPITLPSGCKAFNEAWMILECKKLVGQQISPDAVFDNEEKAKWSQSEFHKMYIGEILNVWVK